MERSNIQIKREVQQVLTENILPFWLNNMQDQERGGWYGRMTGRGQLMKDAPRGAILYARLLWTFSAAYRVVNEGTYLEAATRTKEYILAHFIDCEYGGIFWSVTADGRPLDTKKQFYAIGFMIYGFSEYSRATGDEEALQTAIELYHCIESHAFDHEYNGYIEAMTRDWQPISDMRLSDKDANYPKSQNTHLHIIEPYTNLYRIWPSKELEHSLRNLISIFTNHILNPETHHLDLFFSMDWTRMSKAESYGHDIECSWLLHEAALVLGDKELMKEVEPIVREVAKASEKGLLPAGAMIHESGDADLHWWVQAEAIVGFFNLYQHFGDEAALEKALSLWDYVKSHLIDWDGGEWFWSIRADGSVNIDDDKAGFWKCPYHNSRMCLEILERCCFFTSQHSLGRIPKKRL